MYLSPPYVLHLFHLTLPVVVFGTRFSEELNPEGMTYTRNTHCANDLAPQTSAFALIFPKHNFNVPNPCKQTSLAM